MKNKIITRFLHQSSFRIFLTSFSKTNPPLRPIKIFIITPQPKPISQQPHPKIEFFVIFFWFVHWIANYILQYDWLITSSQAPTYFKKSPLLFDYWTTDSKTEERRGLWRVEQHHSRLQHGIIYRHCTERAKWKRVLYPAQGCNQEVSREHQTPHCLWCVSKGEQ